MRPRPSAAWIVAALLACPAAGGDAVEPDDRAMAAGLRAHIAAQSADGGWRSRTYGAFKDGLSLTPTVLKAIAFAPAVEGSEAARRQGAAFLAARVRADGSIDDGPSGMLYPVYTASAATIALSRVYVPGGLAAQEAFVAELRRRQLGGRLGWRPADDAFGAWGYAVEPPGRPDTPGPGLTVDADLSSTLFAVSALRISGVPADDPAILAALRFVERCQNDGEGGDGGFFLTPTDPARNKAGASLGGRPHSYGSATADGLRALLRCGVAPGHPRARAARAWLERHFSATTVPGTFEAAREPDRDATYFYYAWSVAHAFRSLGLRTIERDGRKVDWGDELAAELARRQRPDGTWSNRFSASKEDDPLVATPFALGALGHCRPPPP